jgi:hypothetical protein
MADQETGVFKFWGKVNAENLLNESGNFTKDGDFLVSKHRELNKYVLTVRYKGKPTHHFVVVGLGSNIPTINDRPINGCSGGINDVINCLRASDAPYGDSETWPVPLKKQLKPDSATSDGGAAAVRAAEEAAEEETATLAAEIREAEEIQAAAARAAAEAEARAAAEAEARAAAEAEARAAAEAEARAAAEAEARAAAEAEARAAAEAEARAAAEEAAREELKARAAETEAAEVARLLEASDARELLRVPESIGVTPAPVVEAKEALEQELAEAATEAYAAAGRANRAADNAEFAGQNAANNSGIAEAASETAYRRAIEAAAAAELANGAAGAAEAAVDNATDAINDVKDAAIAAIAQSSKRAVDEELGDGWTEPTPPPSPEPAPEPVPEPVPEQEPSDDEEVEPPFSLDATVAEFADRAESVFLDGEESSSESSDDEGSLGFKPAPRPVPEAVPRPEAGRVSEAGSTGFRDPLVVAVQRRRAAMAAS